MVQGIVLWSIYITPWQRKNTVCRELEFIGFWAERQWQKFDTESQLFPALVWVVTRCCVIWRALGLWYLLLCNIPWALTFVFRDVTLHVRCYIAWAWPCVIRDPGVVWLCVKNTSWWHYGSVRNPVSMFKCSY